MTIRQGWNPRKQLDFESLMPSIKEHGVLVPIRVRQRENGLELVDGERRLRATLALIEQGAEIVAIPAMVETRATEVGLLVTAFTANQGKPLEPLEEAEVIFRLKNYGLSVEDIKQKLGKSASFVRDRLALIEAEDDVAAAVRNGAVAASTAVQAVKAAKKTGKGQTESLKSIMRAAEKKRTMAQLMDELGLIADTADNYWHATDETKNNDFGAHLQSGMEEIAKWVKSIIVAQTGDDPWADHPCAHCRGASE